MSNDFDVRAYRRASRRELGRITSTSLVAIDWEGKGCGQALSFGLTKAAEARDFLLGVAEGLGLNGDVERLTGLEVYALRAFGGNNDSIVGFENASNGARFIARRWWNERHPDSATLTPMQQQIAWREREIAWLERRLREERSKLDELRSADYVDWESAPAGPEVTP